MQHRRERHAIIRNHVTQRPAPRAGSDDQINGISGMSQPLNPSNSAAQTTKRQMNIAISLVIGQSLTRFSNTRRLYTHDTAGKTTGRNPLVPPRYLL